MKVAIVGTRFDADHPDYMRVKVDVTAFVANLAEDTIVVSGGAQGPDTWAVQAARLARLPDPIVIRPAWMVNDKYDPTAGFKRNSQIVEQADVVVAFWDGKSNGTRDTVNKAHNADKLLVVYRYWSTQ